MTLAPMPDDVAEWIFQHAFTKAMRQAPPGFWRHCDCQNGPSGWCDAGQHAKCAHHEIAYPPSYECTITNARWMVLALPKPYRHPTPTVALPAGYRMHAPMVWLADRMCRWRCPCQCHEFYGVPPGRQIDLFALRSGP